MDQQQGRRHHAGAHVSTSPHLDGRPAAGAAAGQGPAGAAKRRTLDGTHQSAGYHAKQDRVAIDFAELKRALTLEMVLARYGHLSQLKRVGWQLAGPCPVCGSGGRAFVASFASNTWFCFGECDRGGGVLDLVARREQLSIPQAAKLITDRFSLTSPATSQHPQQRRRAMSTANSRPSHRAYVVEDRDGDGSTDQSGFWTRIGSAWPHKDGKGLNIQLVPGIAVSGRMVLREYTDEDAKVDEGKRKPAKK
jgi:hypothetical protein